jgi:formamidopyrimidine-DNA glycosylase
VPELLEVEAYRELAGQALGRRIVRVDAPDSWILKGGLTSSELGRALTGARFVDARRIGKLLLLDVGDGPTLGLRFGMTGVLELDGRRGVDRLRHSSARLDHRWRRFGVGFEDGGTLGLRDPRRLGGVELDPREDRLGVDALVVTPRQLGAALSTSEAPLKARLMDQQRIAGLGNLLTDEVLWRAGLDPVRPAGSLSDAERRRLHRHLRSTLRQLMERGGSHTGDLQIARVRGGRCPRDGTQLERRTVGGRTTYSCPRHQR